ncbi:dachshund d [Pungitius pungitius]|uniref:dachshund d n=1 Tax=Pungitius pungitius TaxID=134920 RepID=UPI002E144FFB
MYSFAAYILGFTGDTWLSGENDSVIRPPDRSFVPQLSGDTTDLSELFGFSLAPHRCTESKYYTPVPGQHAPTGNTETFEDKKAEFVDGENSTQKVSSSSSVSHPSSAVCFSSRPGRPPKRTQSVTSPENPHIMPHSVPGLMSPGMIPPTGLTAAAAAAANAAIAEAMKVKKIKLEAMSGYHGNANHHDGENGDLGSSVGEEGKWMLQTVQCANTRNGILMHSYLLFDTHTRDSKTKV